MEQNKLPEGNSKWVGFCPLPHKKSPIPRNSHQHILCLAPGEVGMVPPGMKKEKRLTVIKLKQELNYISQSLNDSYFWPVWMAGLTLCSHEHWSEALVQSTSSQTRCSAAPPAGSGWSRQKACQTPGCQSGKTWGCRLLDESGFDSAALCLSAWCTDLWENIIVT